MAGGIEPAVAIVGGGWAGLAAAVELSAAGHPVALHEAAGQLGGRARTVDWHGLRLDNGQHLMAGAYTETLALMTRLGTLDRLERRTLELNGPAFRLRLPGLPAPLHLAAGLLTASGLSWREKLAAARFMRGLEKRRFRLPDDPTVLELLERHRQPPELIERLWQPLCLAALNTPLADASGQVFCHVLRDSLAGPRAASDLLFGRADMGRLLPEAAQDFILEQGGSVHLASKVTGLEPDRTGFRLLGPDTRAEHVILAAHPARVPDLLPGLPGMEALAEGLRRMTWQPILTLWLRFAAPLDFSYPMLALGGGDAPWAFERHDIAPGLISIVASADGPHLHIEPDVLLADCLHRLRQRVGPLPALLDVKRIVEKRATFACTPGLWRPQNRTPVQGLWLAGDYTAGDYPATLEGAVRSGVECARQLQEQA